MLLSSFFVIIGLLVVSGAAIFSAINMDRARPEDLIRRHIGAMVVVVVGLVLCLVGFIILNYE